MKQVQLAIFFLVFLVMSSQAQHKKAPAALANHQALYVMDLQKSAHFYKSIIGLEPIPEPFKLGKHAWFKTGPKTSLHIILGAPARKEYYKNNHMCFSVPSLKVFIQHLNKEGISWEDAGGKKSTITTRVDGVLQIWLQDPDGYWIEINNDPSMFD